MATVNYAGLRPVEPVYATVDTYPGDKCGCAWSYLDHEVRERKWQLKYLNAACSLHYLLAQRALAAQSAGRTTRRI